MTDVSSDPEARLVLVIDDDPEIRELVSDVLAQAGFATVTAPDGEEGVALAEARRPGLIVMDVMMREMDEYTALTQLRGHATTRDIPVIMLTGQEEAIYRTLSFGVGAVAHVRKPFSPAAFIETVRGVLAEHGGR